MGKKGDAEVLEVFGGGGEVSRITKSKLKQAAEHKMFVLF